MNNEQNSDQANPNQPSQSQETIAPDPPESTEPSPDPVSPTEPTVPDQPVVATPPLHYSDTKHKILTALSIFTVMLLLSAAYFIGHKTSNSNTNDVAKSPNITKLKAPAPATQDTYLQTAELLKPTPSFFATQTSEMIACNDADNKPQPCDYQYYKIGTTKDNKNIVIAHNTANAFEAKYFLAVGNASAYKIYTNYSKFTDLDAASVAGIRKDLSPTTTLDTEGTLPDIDFDKLISFNGDSFTTGFAEQKVTFGYPVLDGIDSIRGDFLNKAKNTTKVGIVGSKNVYSVTAQEGTNYKVQELYLTVGGVYASSYEFKSPLMIKQNIVWENTKASSDDEFATRAPGCGSPNGYIVGKNLSESDLTLAGTGTGDKKVYILATTSPLFMQIYDEDYASGTNLYGDNVAVLKNLSAEQFQAKRGVFVSKNGLGEYVVYLNQKFLSGGGCGKPVVYLYPTHVQKVSVRVGADVTVSEPAYGARGWQNVLAEPSGKLTFNGVVYPNLFWEGTGRGLYPMIESGTVVLSSNAPQIMRAQLAQQGLNAVETNDFMAFWQPKLPATKYVRLAWLTKAQIDELAPLSITPRPTTTIRVFLDMQGLNRQINVPKQKLTAPTRNGFTAVEWGGLLR